VTLLMAKPDWAKVEADIAEKGFSVTAPLLTRQQCGALTSLYGDDSLFRKRINMARQNYGLGDYGYFAAPLPSLVAALREEFYQGLSPIANRMVRAMGREIGYPASLGEYQKVCAAAGQTRPTPLMLRYGPGGYNRLHRDLYGELAFPIQATALLSCPGEDFTGGEFMLVENRPRQQAIGDVVSLEQGGFVLFATNERPVPGARSMVRASVRHGVSRVTSGERYTLGLIFHDAA
jgi:uncharacterized protein